MIKKPSQARGFTLIEILVVIGIIAVLAAIVIIAINPSKQFAQARNTQRQSNVDAILNAIGQRMADNKGIFNGTYYGAGNTSTPYVCPTLPSLPPLNGVTSTSTIVYIPGSYGVDSGISAGSVDLSCLTPTYISTFPTDPTVSFTSGNTGYTIGVDAAGRVTVCAPNAATESSIPGAQTICVKR